MKTKSCETNLGYLGSELLVPGGVLEEVDELEYLDLGLLAPGHVPEPRADVALLDHLGVRLRLRERVQPCCVIRLVGTYLADKQGRLKCLNDYLQ